MRSLELHKETRALFKPYLSQKIMFDFFIFRILIYLFYNGKSRCWETENFIDFIYNKKVNESLYGIQIS